MLPRNVCYSYAVAKINSYFVGYMFGVKSIHVDTFSMTNYEKKSCISSIYA